MLRAVREARNFGAAQRVIADALPPLLMSILPPEQLQLVRQRLHQLPELSQRRRLTKRDEIGALGICLLSFLATFLVVIPFVSIGDAALALRISNVIAIAMLFLCGYAFGLCSGLRSWREAF